MGGLVLALSLMTAPAQAQTAPGERRPAPAPAPPALRVDANGTRQELMELLEKHPPAVGRVLKLDPSLMRSDSYLAAYPELRDFFAQHPEIPQNAPYYLEGVRVGFNDDYRPRNERVELRTREFANPNMLQRKHGGHMPQIVQLIGGAGWHHPSLPIRLSRK